MRTARFTASCALALAALLWAASPSTAGGKEYAAALAGTLQPPAKADLVFREDGTLRSSLATGTWKAADGKLVQTYKIFGKTQVDKSDFKVTGDDLE